MGLAMILFNIVHPTMTTALLNGTKAANLLRVYTLERLHEGMPGNPLRSLRGRSRSGGTSSDCNA
jgi:hypothetical protein